MQIIDQLALFSSLDLIALSLTVLAWAGLGAWIESERASRPSVTVLMKEYRREWMRECITREPRIFDGAILSDLRQSTNFFASASMIALGALLALIGNSENLLGVAEDLTFAGLPALVVEVKLFCVALFLFHALLKFVWSSRLFGYCAVLMAAIPNKVDDPSTIPRALASAEMNIRAALNFSRGLRSLYFSMTVLAWILGPVFLIAATLVVSAIIWSRDFASYSRKILVDLQDTAN